ncbi:MAG: BtpA/SgcQ family protein [Nanoarchaeota archaeon]|nr:BtpA/SgcQ family protein [Nanoarchaeota archaeon]
MNLKKRLKEEKKVIIGMIHVPALPGTPKNTLSKKEIINKCIKEAKIYKKHGLKVVMIENMHDIPYTKNISHEITKIMAVIGKEVKKLGLYCGIQILAAANKQAMEAAKIAGLDFIRAEGFVYAHIADEGYIESCAGDLLRYRKAIDAEDVLVFTDIKKKHSSHAITSDVNIAETARTAEFFLSDGVIVTGTSTGIEANLEEVKQVKKAVKIPVLIGSGITDKNLKNYFPYADIFIVGSFIKKDKDWKNELDENNIKALIKEFDKLNNK